MKETLETWIYKKWVNTSLNHIKPFGGDVHIKDDLSYYATKADLKKAGRIDTSKLAAKSDLVGLNIDAKIDVGKLKTVLVDLSKLSNVVNNEVVRKTMYVKLGAKVNNIDISGSVLKTNYNTDKSDLEKKIVMQKKVLILVKI